MTKSKYPFPIHDQFKVPFHDTRHNQNTPSRYTTNPPASHVSDDKLPLILPARHCFASRLLCARLCLAFSNLKKITKINYYERSFLQKHILNIVSMGVNKHHEKNSKLKKICIFFCERSLLHKVMLKTISMELYRNDKKNLERKIDFYPE